MVTSPPNTSTMIWAEVESVVRCGSRVGGSTYRRTKRPPSNGSPVPVESLDAVSLDVAIGSGEVLAVSKLSPPDDPEQAATKKSIPKANRSVFQPISLVLNNWDRGF